MSRTDRYRGIQRLAPGLYRVRARGTDPRTGRPREKERRIECADLDAAAAERDKLTAEIESEGGATKPGERERLESFADLWLERKVPRVRPSTADRYRHAVAAITADDLGDWFVDAIRPGDVESWQNRARRRGAAASTVNGWLRVLRQIARSAARDLRLPDFTANVRALPETAPRKNGLTAAELSAILAHVRAEDRAFFPLLLTLATTGARWGEATALKWSDIDLREGTLTIRRAHYRGAVGPTKNGLERSCPIVPALAAELRFHRRRQIAKQSPGLAQGFLFAVKARKKRPGTIAAKATLPAPSSWQKRIDAWNKAAGIERSWSPHDLRRTWVDLSRQAGIDSITRRAIVGHAGENIHERYSTVRDEERAQAAQAVYALATGASR